MRIPTSRRSGIHWPAMPRYADALVLALQYQWEQSQWWPPETLAEHQLRRGTGGSSPAPAVPGEGCRRMFRLVVPPGPNGVVHFRRSGLRDFYPAVTQPELTAREAKTYEKTHDAKVHERKDTARPENGGATTGKA